MSMNEKWNKGISLRKKRWISMIMAAVMIVTLVPFMPGKKAGKVEAAGYNIAAAVAYAKEWGGSKRNPAYKEYDGDCANFVSQCLKAGGLNVYDTWVATVYKGNIIKNLIMDCQSYTKYRPNETTGGIFVSWRRKEELPTGA